MKAFSIVFAIFVAVALLGATAPQARADGDPASDVLATQSLFLPWDANVSSGQQAQLAALLEGSSRAGYPIRVALIASPADLGSVGELWKQPQEYAEFLGEELSLVYRGPLLVIMPDGLGLYQYGAGGRSPAQASALVGALAERSKVGLAVVAAAAVQRLATAAGHHVTASRSVVPTVAAGSDIPWIVFTIGCVLIVLAWTASFRARPLRVGGATIPRPEA